MNRWRELTDLFKHIRLPHASLSFHVPSQFRFLLVPLVDFWGCLRFHQLNKRAHLCLNLHLPPCQHLSTPSSHTDIALTPGNSSTGYGPGGIPQKLMQDASVFEGRKSAEDDEAKCLKSGKADREVEENEGSRQAGGTRAEAINQSITATSSGLRKTSSDFYQRLQT